jgi:hypothetical protein
MLPALNTSYLKRPVSHEVFQGTSSLSVSPRTTIAIGDGLDAPLRPLPGDGITKPPGQQGQSGPGIVAAAPILGWLAAVGAAALGGIIANEVNHMLHPQPKPEPKPEPPPPAPNPQSTIIITPIPPKS